MMEKQNKIAAIFAAEKMGLVKDVAPCFNISDFLWIWTVSSVDKDKQWSIMCARTAKIFELFLIKRLTTVIISKLWVYDVAQKCLTIIYVTEIA